MDEATLVHESGLEIGGTTYQIHIYCRGDGRHFALTRLGGKDIIINDGKSLEEALARHQGVLPLAVGSRVILHEFRRTAGMPLNHLF